MSEETAHPISILFGKQLEDDIFTGKVNLEEAGLLVAIDIADILDNILIVELPRLITTSRAELQAAYLAKVEGLDKYTMGIDERPLKFAFGNFYLISEVLQAIREVTL